MATVARDFRFGDALPVTGTNFAQRKFAAGSSVPVESWNFRATDDVNDTLAKFLGRLRGYGSGNLTFKLRFYPDSATSGDSVWGVRIAIGDVNDGKNLETLSWEDEATATVAAAGSTHEMQEVTVTVTDTGGATAASSIWIQVRRITTAGNADTMSGGAQLVEGALEYSDT